LIPEDFNKEIFDFIKANEKADPFELSLRVKHFSPDIRKLIAQQIHSRQSIRKKIPEWLNFEHIILPEPVSIEQASSELTACYKSEFVNGGTLVDLTGGAGVDTYFFAKRADKVIYVEKDSEIAAIAAYNITLMNLQNVEVICQSAENYIHDLDKEVDFVFLDPSRRIKGEKVFKLEDSDPNVLALQDNLFAKSKQIIIKAAPYLDLQYAIKKIKKIKEIHIVAVDNECKEIVILSDESILEKDIKISTVNFAGTKVQKYSSSISAEQKSKCEMALSGRFIYDPNVAIRKAGLLHSLCHKFDLLKPAYNSHIYFSDTLHSNFPGRIFKLIEIVPFNRFMKNPPVIKANIAIRNFPFSVAEIRKRTKINEGGEMYIFGTTDQNKNLFFIICQKVSYNTTK
jgi:16S rRNA G966 N2-methylase RsmD